MLNKFRPLFFSIPWIWIICFFEIEILFGQQKKIEYPNQIDLIVIPQVVGKDSGKNPFLYSYEVKSSLKSIQGVESFGLVTSEKPFKIESPLNWGYYDTSDSHPNTPKFGYWGAEGYDEEETKNFDGNQILPPNNMIKPGTSQKGFKMYHIGTSGVVKYFALGFVKLEEGEEGSGGENENFWEHVYWGQTVGPVKLADPTLKRLIPRLKELLEKARELKWVDVKYFPQFMAPLELILSSFAKKGESTELNQFIQDYLKLFDRLKASLDPNFYFLMVPNLEYILLKIGEETK